MADARRVPRSQGESASQVKVLQLECEMLTKKVRLLEGQHHSLEAAANRRQGDAEMRLAEQSARLEHYEAWRGAPAINVSKSDIGG